MSTHTWATLLAAYTTAQRAAGRSPGTIRLHRYRILDLAAEHATPRAVTTDHLVAILAEHVDVWAPETRKSVRGSWRSFFGWACRTGRLPRDPSAALDPVTVPRA